MSTQFESPDAALDHGLLLLGVSRETANLVEDPNLVVVPMWLAFVEDAEYPAERNEAISHQKGYRGKGKAGVEFGLIIDVFRDGWCVWVTNMNGAATRL